MLKGIVTDVFFDLDHTLWDFERNSALTFKKILDESDIQVELTAFLEVYKPINLDFWKLYREEKISQATLRHQRLKLTFKRLGYRISDQQIALLSSQYISYLCTYSHLLPNALEVLDYLKPSYKLHIITNGFQKVQDSKLKNANLFSYFNQIVNSEMAGVKKPNPKIFQLALDKSRVTAERSVMIGDSIEADILGAQALGMHTIHYNAHNDPKHDLCKIINDLGEIKFLL